MLQFTCKFTCIFTLTFRSQLLITLIPLCYKVEIWYGIYPDQDLRLHGNVAPGVGRWSEWGWGKGNSHMGKGLKAGASVYFGHMSSFFLFFVFFDYSRKIS